MPVAVGLALGALFLPLDGALADPRPSISQAKAKLEKLNDKADKVVDRYNTATEKYKKAKKTYDGLNTRYKSKLARVAGLRAEVVGMAVNAYQGVDATTWSSLMGDADPTATLGSMALMGQMTAERAQTLAAFDEENRQLKADKEEAQGALTEADKLRDDVKSERDKILELVEQQEKLLRRLGAYRVGNPNSTGLKYTGSASGNAAAVLSFAYAQIGKPYQYGGTGPGGWDCSGLTQASWRAAGVSLPRTTWEQWAWGAKRRVSLDKLQPGDLVFSSGLGHVSIYAGGGKIVHAPQTGDVVKVASLSSYGGRLVGAIRP
ncbi:NlpC/P60 family protein [Nonomuraea sp. NPDC003804]|uniref:C40 family peptidase n=1 Tax=Nonomuraea sp. NPDC003804 TaxID=3154547 RepID=UPI0033A36170